MAKDKRLFARFDLDYADHPKIMMLSDAAFRAHVEMVLYSRKYLTDGFIPKRIAKRFGSESVRELLANDRSAPSLVDFDDDSFLLHGYSDMNETRAEVDKKRLVNAENGRRGGLAKKRNASEPVSGSSSGNGSENVAETETETETEVSSKELTTRARKAFESAWVHWPKKTEKKKSLEQFELASKKLTVDGAVSCVRKFGGAYAATTETQFVPALAVWLRNERWTDDLPQPSKPSRQSMSRADEANDFVSRLEAKDGTFRSGEAVGGRRELRQ